MKFSKAAVPLCAIVAASVTFMVGCNDDSDLFDEPADLDVNQTVPLFKRNSQFDIIQNNSNYRDVPKEKDECMLNAMLQIAVDQRKKVFGKTISSEYSAAEAYEKVKKCAMDYVKTDASGNPDPTYVPYTGGAMLPSLAAEIGKQSGILEGGIMHFESYEDMKAFLSTEEWREKHSDGSYIINSESERHASICTGIAKDGNIKIKSAENRGGSTMNPNKVDYTGFTVVY